jgi:hypothetical protein
LHEPSFASWQSDKTYCSLHVGRSEGFFSAVAIRVPDKLSMAFCSCWDCTIVCAAEWSICCGQGWTERAIFGKIRYMNYAGCKRKFNIAGYVAAVKRAVREEASRRAVAVGGQSSSSAVRPNAGGVAVSSGVDASTACLAGANKA